MSGDLIKANQLPVSSMHDLTVAGDFLAQIDMLGAGNSAEGFVIAATCHQTGMSYLEFAENYNMVNGRPSKKADAMLSRFNELGGEHEVVDRSPERAAITMLYKGKTKEFALTWDEAIQEPFIYQGGPNAQMAELQKPFEKRLIKPKYQTPRSRMQMLWARLVSDAVRCVCPKANKGCYTRDEIEDFTEDRAPAGKSPVAVDDAIDVASLTPDGQQGAAQQANASDDPFVAPDFNVCTVPDCEFTGKQWSELPSDQLKVAANQNLAGVEQGHRDAINKILQERGDV